MVRRVVFDTNIFLSAFIFGGNPEKLFELARVKRIHLFTSPSILAEFADRLRDKFGWSEEDIVEAIRTVGYSSELVKPTQRLAVLEDDPDNRILECAVEVEAKFIVSGDRHLLRLGKYQGIEIISATELLSKIEG
ncbi:MAG TPA: putative toxin-antitoxin system toxin component, PIN family [Actinobacteria bacterium]|nr:putative toxin-antitoxin system toxin component, PIN family [Actinomycetota bacterium]